MGDVRRLTVSVGEEVRTIKYAKPEVVKLTAAVAAIHGTRIKDGMFVESTIPPLYVTVTPLAYEADE